jgi:hypothetical protein
MRIDEVLRKVNGKWALVSRKDPTKVLQYYHGPHDQKPSAAWVSKVERRVHSFHETLQLLENILNKTDNTD